MQKVAVSHLSYFNGHPDPPSILIFGKELNWMQDLAGYSIKTRMLITLKVGTQWEEGEILRTGEKHPFMELLHFSRGLT